MIKYAHPTAFSPQSQGTSVQEANQPTRRTRDDSCGTAEENLADFFKGLNADLYGIDLELIWN